MIVGMRNSKYKQVQFLANNLRRENKIRKGIKYSLERNVKERIHQMLGGRIKLEKGLDTVWRVMLKNGYIKNIIGVWERGQIE